VQILYCIVLNRHVAISRLDEFYLAPISTSRPIQSLSVITEVWMASVAIQALHLTLEHCTQA